MTEPVSLDDFEHLARERLSHMTHEFVAGGAADEITLRWNRESFDRIRLRPRVLEDVANIDTEVTLFGETLPHPILLAPVWFFWPSHPLRGILSALKSDEIHPNARGYQLMAERISGPCSKLIRKAGSAR